MKNQMEIQVIENVIPETYQDRIEQLMTDVRFPWGYLNDVTYSDTDRDKGETPGFAHLFFDAATGTQSDHCNFILPLLWQFAPKEHDLWRIKGGLLLNTNEGPNNKHIDFNEPHTTALYYVNDSDGDTVFFDESGDIIYRSEPKKGKVIIFNGFIYHASTCPTSTTTRIALNFNYDC